MPLKFQVGEGLHSLSSVKQGYYIQVYWCSLQLGGDCQLFLCHWTNWIQYKKPPPTLSNEISLHISQINWKILLLDSVKYLLLNTGWLLQLIFNLSLRFIKYHYQLLHLIHHGYNEGQNNHDDKAWYKCWGHTSLFITEGRVTETQGVTYSQQTLISGACTATAQVTCQLLGLGLRVIRHLVTIRGTAASPSE